MFEKINWKSLEFEKQKDIVVEGNNWLRPLVKEKVHYHTTQMPIVIRGLTRNIIGVDPGRNYGFTIIEPSGLAHVLNGKLVKQEPDEAYTLYIIRFVSSLLSRDAGWNDDNEEWDLAPEMSIVEGAAYDKTFGQVGLEAVRCGFYTGLKLADSPVEIAPPSTVRKHVLGNGMIQASDLWLINHNAADSIAIALYGVYLYSQNGGDVQITWKLE